jgi:hypothetical protein
MRIGVTAQGPKGQSVRVRVRGVLGVSGGRDLRHGRYRSQGGDRKSRVADPRDDITTTLVHAQLDSEALARADLGPFIMLLLAAGNETTRAAISHGLWTLTEFPDEKRRRLEDLDGRAATAAEEIVVRRPRCCTCGAR